MAQVQFKGKIFVADELSPDDITHAVNGIFVSCVLSKKADKNHRN